MEQKDNSGVLFKNGHKKMPKHPDLKGYAHINGAKYWVAVWENTTKSGGTIYSMSFEADKPVYEQGDTSVEDDFGDIPF